MAVEHACTYCGLLSNGVDHVPPTSARQGLIDVGLSAKYPFVEVRCCSECNSALGARSLWTVPQRKTFIKRWIARRYKKYLRIPNWAAGELAELSGHLQDSVLHGLAVRDLTRYRLDY